MDVIVNKKEIRDFIYCLHVVTKCKIVIYDDKFNIICSHPEGQCEFCDHIISKPNGRTQCDCSNISSFLKCKKDGKLNIYHCHTSTFASKPVNA